MEDPRAHLQEALRSLCFSESAEERARANVWLLKWQQADDATPWTVSLSILREPAAHPRELLIFCAQSLKVCLSSRLRDPAVDVGALVDSVVGVLPAFAAKASDPILVQLSLVLAILLANLPDPADALMSVTRCIDNVTANIAVLTHIVEGVFSKKHLKHQQHNLAKEKIRGIAAQLMTLLFSYISQGDVELQTAVLNVCKNWFSYKMLPLHTFFESPILASCYDILSRPEVNEELQSMASEVLLEALALCGGTKNPNDTDAEVVGARATATLLNMTLTAASKHEPTQALCSVLVSLGNANVPNIIDTVLGARTSPVAEQWAHLVEVLLSLAGHSCNAVAFDSFKFWTSVNTSVHAGGNSAASAAFEPYFTRLTSVLVAQGTFSESYEQQDEDERNDFCGRFRNDVRDTIREYAVKKCCHGNIYINTLLKRSYDALECVGSGSSWRSLEAELHALSAVAAAVPIEESQYLPSIIACLPQLPQHPGLLNTAVVLVGVLAPWIAAHPTALGAAMNLVTASLNITESDPIFPMRQKNQQDHSGCVAWVKLCKQPGIQSAVVQAGFLPRFLELFLTLAPGETPNPCVQVRSSKLFLEGLVLLLGALPPEAYRSGLSSVLDPLMGRVVSFSRRRDPLLVHALEIVGVAFSATGKGGRSTGPSVDVTCVVENQFPAILSTALEWRAENSVMQALLRVLRDLLPLVHLVAVKPGALDSSPCPTPLLLAMAEVLAGLADVEGLREDVLETIVVLIRGLEGTPLHDTPSDGAGNLLQSLLSRSILPWLQACTKHAGGYDEEPEWTIQALKVLETAGDCTPHVLSYFEGWRELMVSLVERGLCVQHPGVTKGVLSFLSRLGAWAKEPNEASDDSTARCHLRRVVHAMVEQTYFTTTNSDAMLDPVSLTLPRAGQAAGVSMGAALLYHFLDALFGAMPRTYLNDLVQALWDIRAGFDAPLFARWLHIVLRVDDEGGELRLHKDVGAWDFLGLPRHKVCVQAVADLTAPAMNKQKFKTFLKKLCGGKAKQLQTIQL